MHLVGGGAFAQAMRSMCVIPVQAAAAATAAEAPLLVPKPRGQDGTPQDHADHAEMANVHRATNANVKGKIQHDHDEANVAGGGRHGSRSRRSRSRSRSLLIFLIFLVFLVFILVFLLVLRGRSRGTLCGGCRPHQQVVGGQQQQGAKQFQMMGQIRQPFQMQHDQPMPFVAFRVVVPVPQQAAQRSGEFVRVKRQFQSVVLFGPGGWKKREREWRNSKKVGQKWGGGVVRKEYFYIACCCSCCTRFAMCTRTHRRGFSTSPRRRRFVQFATSTRRY